MRGTFAANDLPGDHSLFVLYGGRERECRTPAASLDLLLLGRAYRPDELEMIGEPAQRGDVWAYLLQQEALMRRIAVTALQASVSVSGGCAAPRDTFANQPAQATARTARTPSAVCRYGSVSFSTAEGTLAAGHLRILPVPGGAIVATGLSG